MGAYKFKDSAIKVFPDRETRSLLIKETYMWMKDMEGVPQ